MSQPELDPFLQMQIVANFFEAHGITYRVVGSLASVAYGEPRFTNDADIVAEIPMEKVDSLCEAFAAPDYYVSETAVREAIARRLQFNIVHPASGFKIDVILPADTEYGRLEMSRGKRLTSEGCFSAWFGSPEDVLLNKLVYYRMGESEKHLRDIAGMMKSLGNDLDTAYVAEWAGKLGVAAEWEMILERMK